MLWNAIRHHAGLIFRYVFASTIAQVVCVILLYVTPIGFWFLVVSPACGEMHSLEHARRFTERDGWYWFTLVAKMTAALAQVLIPGLLIMEYVQFPYHGETGILIVILGVVQALIAGGIHLLCLPLDAPNRQHSL